MKNKKRYFFTYIVSFLLLNVMLFAEDTRVLKLSSHMNFGSAEIGQEVNRTLTISNAGNSDLHISKLRFHQRLNGVFTGTFSGTIPPNEQRDVTITFKPKRGISYAGLLYVESDKTNKKERSRVLKGIGIDTNNSLETKILRLDSILDFGEVAINTTKTKDFIIHNDGNSELTVNSLHFHSKLQGAFQALDFIEESIDSNGEKRVTIAFTPTSEKSYSGLLYVNARELTNSGDRKTIIVKGSGVIESENNETTDLNRGLVAYYKFEGNVNDSSGNGNDGVQRGTISYVDGVIGKSAKFDGLSNIKTPIELRGVEENQYLSISFWGIAEDKNKSTFIGNYNYGDGSNSIYFGATKAGISGGFDGYWDKGFCYKHINTYLVKYIGNRESKCGKLNYLKDIYDYGSTPVDYTQWHHYTITYNNHYEKIFIDGQKVIQRELGANAIGGENGVSKYPRYDDDYDRFLNIGMYNNSFAYSQSALDKFSLKGKIDDLRIYKRALTELEVKKLYELGLE